MIEWKIELIKEVIKLWNARYSAREIAKIKGISHNSILGKMRRMRNRFPELNIRRNKNDQS